MPQDEGWWGLTFSSSPSPWLTLTTQEGGQSHQGHWPWAWHPSLVLRDRAEEDTWETRPLQKIFLFKNYNQKPFKEIIKPPPPPHPSQKSKKYFFLRLAVEWLGWGQAQTQEPCACVASEGAVG